MIIWSAAHGKRLRTSSCLHRSKMDGVLSLNAARPSCSAEKSEETFEENGGERLEYISSSRPLQGLFQDKKFFCPIRVRTPFKHHMTRCRQVWERVASLLDKSLLQ